MAASKSAAIAELVAQLKSGAITKAELFVELQRLKGGVGADAGAGVAPAAATPAAVPPPAPRAAPQAPPLTAAPPADGAARRRPDPIPSRSGNGGSPTTSHSRSPSPAAGGHLHNSPAPWGSRPGALAAAAAAEAAAPAAPSDTPSFQPRTTPLPEAYRAVLDAVPFPDRVRAWEAHRREGAARLAAEAAQRETEHCTFRPAINAGVGGGSGAGGSPTAARGSFAGPRGAAPSDGGAAPSAVGIGGVGGGSVYDRLYRTGTPSSKAHQAAARGSQARQTLYDAASGAGGGDGEGDGGAARGRRMSGAGGSSRRGGSVGHGDASGRPLFPVLSHDDRPPSELTREELELAACTFKPKVNPTIDARPVRSRYMEAAAAVPPAGGGASGAAGRRASFGGAGGAGGGGTGPLPSGLEHCTFRPVTNRLRPQDMPAAALYVSAPIYERLARTQTAAQASRESAVAASSAAAASAAAGAAGSPDGGAPSPLAWPPGAARRRGSLADGSSAAGASDSPAARAAREAGQAAFLARQDELLRRKAETAAALTAATAPPLEPALCRRSLEIVASSGRSREGFLDRLARETQRKEAELLKTSARLTSDPECTFAPTINRVSQALPGRSAVEMSRGDALRRETHQRLLRLRSEADTLGDVTFQPAINERSRRSEGRLRVLDDPSAYVARLAAEAAVAAEKAQRAAAETSAREMDECTFAPKVHDAPSYIHRIAQSMALARAGRQQGSEAGEESKPDWR